MNTDGNHEPEFRQDDRIFRIHRILAGGKGGRMAMPTAGADQACPRRTRFVCALSPA